MWPFCKRRLFAAFTLVEMLVVIGIIALLISIMLPTISAVRRQANTLKCASNLRTFGQAWQQYCNKNNGTCVPGRLPTGGAPGGDFDFGNGLEYRPRWYELLGAEVHLKASDHVLTTEDDTWRVKPDTIFLCPAVPEFDNSRNYPYGYNYQFLGNARPVMSGAKAYIMYPVKVSRISASQTIMVADSNGTAAGKPIADRTGYGYTGSHDPFGVLNKGWCIDPPRMTSTSDYADPERRNPPDRAGPDPRHNGKSNALFCDGHVQLMSPQEMGYIVLPDGSMPINGPGATNKLFSGRGTDLDPPSINGQ